MISYTLSCALCSASRPSFTIATPINQKKITKQYKMCKYKNSKYKKEKKKERKKKSFTMEKKTGLQYNELPYISTSGSPGRTKQYTTRQGGSVIRSDSV